MIQLTMPEEVKQARMNINELYGVKVIRTDKDRWLLHMAAGANYLYNHRQIMDEYNKTLEHAGVQPHKPAAACTLTVINGEVRLHDAYSDTLQVGFRDEDQAELEKLLKTSIMRESNA